MRPVIGPFRRWYAATWRQGLVRLEAMMESGHL
jgi:hypothetical protein